MSERSQTGMLQTLLEKNGRWENGRLKQDTSAIKADEVEQIRSALRFLEQRNALRRMTWLPMPLESFPKINGVYDDAPRCCHLGGIEPKGRFGENEYPPVGANEPFEGIDTKGFPDFTNQPGAFPGEKGPVIFLTSPTTASTSTGNRRNRDGSTPWNHST
ncbi:MAG: hypothetical protein IPJ82_07065 [Lewinellaceae bacterium]|nr:hypothetical protein [Lewinellaceae bacterium]